MKKLLALLLALIMIFSIFACGETKSRRDDFDKQMDEFEELFDERLEELKEILAETKTSENTESSVVFEEEDYHPDNLSTIEATDTVVNDLPMPDKEEIVYTFEEEPVEEPEPAEEPEPVEEELKTSFDILLSGDSNSQFVPGDMVFVSAFNIANPEEITFSSELTHGGEKIVPKFYADGNNAYAIIPTTYETAPGTYNLEFNYKDENYVFAVTIEEKKNTILSPAFNVGENIAYYTDETKAKYNAFLDEFIANNDFSTKYFTDELFEIPTEYTRVIGYGRESLQEEGFSYLRDGMDCTTSGNIVVDMDGKVIAVAYTELSGHTVVIDHGYGLLSFYRCLDGDSIVVEEGQIVKRGDEIAGKVGGNCFTDGKTLRYAVTVNSLPVCPYDLWEAPIAFK